MKVTVFHANECDKRKCTAFKMEKQGKCRIVYKIHQIPRGAVVLNPFSEKAVSYEDRGLVENKGIVGLDCSWNKVSSSASFFSLSKYHRSLPFLIAATFYITGFKEEAHHIMDGFKWGHSFIEMNYDLLEAYSSVKTSEEVVKIQNEFLEDHK